MRIILLFILAFFTTVISSCKHEEAPDLSFVETIYCTPQDPSTCLPLEIVNTKDGWQAIYIGTPSKDIISLKPQYYNLTDNDTTIVFEEYLNGKLNGSYIFPNITERDESDLFPYILYESEDGEKSVRFDGIVVRKNDLVIDNRDITNSMNCILNSKDVFKGKYGPERRDINFEYLIHSNPLTLIEPYINTDDFQVSTSPDGKFRIYLLRSWIGEETLSKPFYFIPVQYMTNLGVITLSDISSCMYDQLRYFKEAASPKMNNIVVLQASLHGRTFYLVEALYQDLTPMSFSKDFKIYTLALYAFSIEKGKLVPSKILEGKTVIEVGFEYENSIIHFKYDDKTKELQVPIVDSTGDSFTGKYRVLKLK